MVSLAERRRAAEHLEQEYAVSERRSCRVIEIDHGNGIRTLYAHLHKILVEKGEVVEASDRIGLVGNSGRTTGAHLHYEIQVDGRPTDPIKFLKAGKRTVQG